MNDKQNKKKVVVEKYFCGEIYYCPSCQKHLGYDYNNFSDVNFCSKCGQQLEWHNLKV